MDDAHTVSLSVLIAAMRHQYVTDPTIRRVLVEAFGLDDATAKAHLDGRPPAPDPAQITDCARLAEMLAAAHERKDFPAAAALAARLAELTPDAKLRANLLYALATLQRDELHDVEAALESFGQALDTDPAMTRAFAAIERLLAQQEDWKRLEREHRKMIVRVRGGDPDLECALFQALGRIYRDRLGHMSSAIEAFRAALRLRPGDEATLAELRALGVAE